MQKTKQKAPLMQSMRESRRTTRQKQFIRAAARQRHMQRVYLLSDKKGDVMKTAQQLKAISSMTDEQLIKQREIISTSIDYDKDTQDLLMDAIDKRLNRVELSHEAVVPEPDLKFGEL